MRADFTGCFGVIDHQFRKANGPGGSQGRPGSGEGAKSCDRELLALRAGQKDSPRASLPPRVAPPLPPLDRTGLWKCCGAACEGIPSQLPEHVLEEGR